ncbi:hypothetical protein Hanom_Chr15g01359941 [Helianthus anomalus]
MNIIQPTYQKSKFIKKAQNSNPTKTQIQTQQHIQTDSKPNKNTYQQPIKKVKITRCKPQIQRKTTESESTRFTHPLHPIIRRHHRRRHTATTVVDTLTRDTKRGRLAG